MDIKLICENENDGNVEQTYLLENIPFQKSSVIEQLNEFNLDLDTINYSIGRTFIKQHDPSGYMRDNDHYEEGT